MNARPVKKTSEVPRTALAKGPAPTPRKVTASPEERELAKAFLGLGDETEAIRFLRDLCTPGEISALAERWHVARLLNEGRLSYREIHARTGVSTTTIARVARFLFQERFQGYRAVLDRMKETSSGS